MEFVLRNCPTFKAADCRVERIGSIDWLPATLRDYAMKRRLAARQTLFSEGDPSNGVYEVVSGKLKLEQTDTTGRPIVLGFASAGDTIAEASVFAPAYRCDATAMEESVVRVYPKAALFAEFERNPRAARAFMAVLAHRVTDLRSRLERRGLRSARDRVRHYLRPSGQPRNRTVVLSGTLKDLAAELGLTHEVLYRTLSEMEADGEIVRRQRAITVDGGQNAGGASGGLRQLHAWGASEAKSVNLLCGQPAGRLQDARADRVSR
jgi:CRP-like cAMP-binding protein